MQGDGSASDNGAQGADQARDGIEHSAGPAGAGGYGPGATGRDGPDGEEPRRKKIERVDFEFAILNNTCGGGNGEEADHVHQQGDVPGDALGVGGEADGQQQHYAQEMVPRLGK